MTTQNQTSASDIKEWKHQLYARLVHRDIDIPKGRLVLKEGDIGWLNRNFWIRNSKHPAAKEVAKLIRLLMKAGVR